MSPTLTAILLGSMLAHGIVDSVYTGLQQKQTSGRSFLQNANATSDAKVIDATTTEVGMTVTSLALWLKENGHDKEYPSESYLEENAEYALRAKKEFPAAAQVSSELFHQYVLPYRQLDEPVDNWRPTFFDRLSHLGKTHSTLRDLADAVIPFAFTGMGKNVVFKGNSTPQVMAPMSETLANGYASCTGLSIFLVDALRAVGVPARVVGTPEWNLPTGGNHNWIEAWLGDGWHYTDAAPQAKVEWDNAWFTAQNTQLAVEGDPLHGIYTPVWDKTHGSANYSLTWREPKDGQGNVYPTVPALDRTAAYKDLAKSKWNPEWEPYRQASEGLR